MKLASSIANGTTNGITSGAARSISKGIAALAMASTLLVLTACGEGPSTGASATNGTGVTSASSVASATPSVSNSSVPTDTSVGTPGLLFSSGHGGYEVTGYDGPEANVVIPDEYEGYPVIAIADHAFADAQIDSITLGRNVTLIDHDAFRRCKYLEVVNLNSALQEIDYDAFESCTSLRVVNIPSDSALAEIDTCAFMRCKSLESFAVPASCTYLGNGCFKDCVSLTQVTFPSGWNGNVDMNCFQSCTSISSIDIPGLASLGQGAFSGWTSAQSIHIGSNLDGVQWCYSGRVYDRSVPEGSGNSIYDLWFENCEASVTTA